MSGPTEIHELIRRGETMEVEFKDFPTPPEVVAESICALLNDKGGTLLLGVADSGRISGVPNAVQVAKHLEKALLENITPGGAWSLSLVQAGDSQVIMIDASRGGRKPYLVNGTIYVRRGTRTVRATAKDLDRLIQERMLLDERWERRPIREASLKDLDQAEIRTAAKEIEASGRLHFTKPADSATVLKELSLLADGQITNAALMLFGHDPVRFYRQSGFRITVFASDKTGSDYLHDEFIDGHLFGNLSRLITILQRNSVISSRFVEGHVRREDQPGYPFWALREGVLNALIHRDFSSPSGGASLGIYPGRVEIWNSGSLPEGLNPAALKREHPSLPRNPDIAQVCFLRGLIERIGRGTQLIAQACIKAHLKPPKWTSDPTGTRLVFTGSRSLRGAEHMLNNRQRDLLSRLDPGDTITVAGYAETRGGRPVTERTARSDLAALVQAGLLIAQGQGRARAYVRTELRLPDSSRKSKDKRTQDS